LADVASKILANVAFFWPAFASDERKRRGNGQASAERFQKKSTRWIRPTSEAQRRTQGEGLERKINDATPPRKLPGDGARRSL